MHKAMRHNNQRIASGFRMTHLLERRAGGLLRANVAVHLMTTVLPLNIVTVALKVDFSQSEIPSE